MNMENKYTISLIIEDNFVSEVFKEEIEQVKEKLQQLSNIKQLNTYRLTGNDNVILLNENQETVNLLDRKSSKNETHLVLVISDTNSLLWNNTQAYNFFNELKEISLLGLISYERLDPLKERSINMSTQIYFDILPNARTNLDMKVDNETSWAMIEDYPHGLFLPSATLGNVDELFNEFTSAGKVGSVMIYDNIHHRNFYNAIKNLKGEKKLNYDEKKMDRYRYGADVNGYQLAAYLSILDDFTVSDIKFLQQHMLPESNKNTLNYLALSSLVDKVDSDNVYTEKRYKIKEDLCPILQRSLRNKDANAVELLIKEKNTYISSIENINKCKI